MMRPMRLGVLGGGQFARLLGHEAKALGIELHILDPDPQCPAAGEARRFIVAPWGDFEALMELARNCDAVTLDVEVPPAGCLRQLEDKGFEVHPGSFAVGILQDKLLQRRHFQRHGLEQPRFAAVTGPLREALKHFGSNCVIKARKSSYAGRRVLMPQGNDDIRMADWRVASLLEEKVPIAMKLGVVLVRGRNGQALVDDPVELVTYDRQARLNAVPAAARLERRLEAETKSLALRAVQSLQGVGIFGVELFLDSKGRVLINEVSLPVHNRWHPGFESCATSQLSNHLRAVLGLPLKAASALHSESMTSFVGSFAGQVPNRRHFRMNESEIPV